MDQSKKNPNILHDGQFQYLGRWVDKKHFRAFVYNKDGSQKLADSYEEFEDLVTSGIWFATKDEASTKQGKPKNVAISNGK